jgi:hypothetical protein
VARGFTQRLEGSRFSVGSSMSRQQAAPANVSGFRHDCPRIFDLMNTTKC